MQRKGQKNEITPPDSSEWARERNPTQGVLWVRFIILSLRDFSRWVGHERVRNKQTNAASLYTRALGDFAFVFLAGR